MRKKGKAYFVDFPRNVDDLKVLHDVAVEQKYEIVKIVRLSSIDYENFVTDMVADRQFIEDSCELCFIGKVWKCLLVQQQGKSDGILVIPVDRRYVKYAAHFRGERTY